MRYNKTYLKSRRLLFACRLVQNTLMMLLQIWKKDLPQENRRIKMSRIYTSSDQLIGHTPLLELSKIEKEYGLKARILAKLEYLNP